ncbi:hypothetical protein ACFP1Z_28685 [Streptomyces gamaensis]|uniref:Uncharacterized protein n=1 Tax=Streptomyces gamaensis TaxID=1763542 RepID=A0ABW0ZC37_9ACTN
MPAPPKRPKRGVSMDKSTWNAVVRLAAAQRMTVSEAFTAVFAAYGTGSLPHPPAPETVYTERGSGTGRGRYTIDVPGPTWTAAATRAGMAVDPGTGRITMGASARYRSMSNLAEALGQALVAGTVTLAGATAVPADT